MKSLSEQISESLNERARPPKLTGRELKARNAKSAVMKKLGKSDKFQVAKDKLMRIAEIEAKQIAREIGVPFKIIDLDKIKLKKE